MMSGINRSQPPRRALSGTLLYRGINLLLSGLCPEPTRGCEVLWDRLRCCEAGRLCQSRSAGLSFFICPPVCLFSRSAVFSAFGFTLCTLLIAVNTLLQSIFAQPTLILLVGFVHIHCTTVFKILVFDFLCITLFYIQNTSSTELFLLSLSG